MQKKCPLRFSLSEKKQGCIGNECEWFRHLTGLNPQTGQPTDEWSCAIGWLPLLLVEVAKTNRETTASTDKVANQVNKGRAEFLGALSEEAQKRLINADPKIMQISSNGG